MIFTTIRLAFFPSLIMRVLKPFFVEKPFDRELLQETFPHSLHEMDHWKTPLNGFFFLLIILAKF